jgi:hypothetical protein
MEACMCGLSKPAQVLGFVRLRGAWWEDIRTSYGPICVKSGVPMCASRVLDGDGDEDKGPDRRSQPITVSTALWTQLLVVIL